jgi:DNA-binding NtrC family response regulator
MAIRPPLSRAAPAGDPLGLPLPAARDEVLARFERDYLDRALRASGGRVGLTARRAGISERALFEKMRRYGLRKEDYRA